MNANEHNVIEKLNSMQPRMDLPFYLISPKKFAECNVKKP
jgi:hypothetical protein